MRKLTGGLQEGIVTLLAFDTTLGAKQIAGLVDPKILDPYFRTIAVELIDFLNKYNKPSGEHVLEIIQEIIQRKPEETEIYERLCTSIFETRHQINRGYVVGKLGVFVRIQRAKATMTKCLPLLNRHDESSINEVEGILSGLAKQNVDLAASGTFLNDPKQALQFLDRRDDEYLPLGIEPIDEASGCPKRKGLWLGISSTGIGKSWLAVHTGKNSLIRGKKVCHITLEMSEAEVSQRYMQALFSVSLKEAESVQRQYFQKDQLGRMTGFETKKLKNRPYMGQENIREVLTKRLAGLKTRPRLVIKEFPSGQLTVRALKGYISHLESAHNFLPDQFLIDYPDLMHLDPKYKREALGTIYVELRGIAAERNASVCVYSQSNRLGMGAKLVDLNRVSEDASKVHTADAAITVNQTDAEKRLGLARLYQAKNRHGDAKFQVLISQALSVGQFAFEAIRMVDSVYWPLVEGTGDSDESED